MLNIEDQEKHGYEISFLLRAVEDAAVIAKHLSEFKADILNESRIQEINLAYPIKKLNKAYFGYIIFNSSPLDIAKLNENLKLDQKVLRFLIIMSPVVKNQERKPEVAEVTEKPKETVVERDLSIDALEAKLEEMLK